MRTISIASLLLWLVVDDKPHLLSTRNGSVYFNETRVANGSAAGLARNGAAWYALIRTDSALQLLTDWSPTTIVDAPVRSAALAVDANGGVHIAWLAKEHLWYRAPNGTRTSVPPLPNFDQFAGPLDLQIDSEGQPGVVFVLGGEGNSTGFWRPGRATARVIDARGQEADDADVRLVFEGTKPRVFFYGQIDDLGKGVFLAKSSDDGVNWESAFRIPSSGRLRAVAACSKEQAVITDTLSRSINFQRFRSASLPFPSETATYDSACRLWLTQDGHAAPID